MDDVEQIKQLKYRYLRTLDTKQWVEFEDCFLPDATADYAGLVFGDRAELVGYLRENMGEGLLSMHQVHHPEISVEGDAAIGTWYLQDRVLVPDMDFVLEGAAFYEDRYARTEAGWKVSHTGYRRTFEMTFSTADWRSFTVKRGTAYDAR